MFEKFYLKLGYLAIAGYLDKPFGELHCKDKGAPLVGAVGPIAHPHSHQHQDAYHEVLNNAETFLLGQGQGIIGKTW